MKQENGPFLELVEEVKIRDLIDDSGRTRYEASGVHLKGGLLHIIFDNTHLMLKVNPDRQKERERASLLTLAGTGKGYEDLTFHPSAKRWYCLIEATERKKGVLMPRIDVFDEEFAFLQSDWLDFPLMSGNKGFEGIAILQYGGEEYLIGMCEGNDCRSGDEGANPGKGRIQVFSRDKKRWKQTGTINLPKSVMFKDYTGIDVRGTTLSVISQESSALWIGNLRSDRGRWDDIFEDEGKVLHFPRDEKGRKIYCNLEGITWLGDDRIVVVSDKTKAEQPGRCEQKDQSIHIFRIRE